MLEPASINIDPTPAGAPKWSETGLEKTEQMRITSLEREREICKLEFNPNGVKQVLKRQSRCD